SRRRDYGLGSRAACPVRSRRRGRRADAGAGREALHSESAGPSCRRRAQGGRAARHEPQRPLPAAAALWTVVNRPVAPRRARNLELTLPLLVLGGALPAVALALYLIGTRPMAPEVRWTLAAVVIGVWLSAASAARQVAIRSLNLIANLLGALR